MRLVRAVGTACIALLIGAPAPTRAQDAVSAAHERMVARLQAIRTEFPHEEQFRDLVDSARLEFAALAADAPVAQRVETLGTLAEAELRIGNLEDAAGLFRETLVQIGNLLPAQRGRYVLTTVFLLGVTELRRAQNEGCVSRPRPGACTLPTPVESRIDANRVRAAYPYFADIVRNAPPDHPINIASRWLLNVGATLGGDFPDSLSDDLLLPASIFEAETDFPRFSDRAAELGAATFGFAGGVVVEDLDGDGLLDIATSNLDPAGQVRILRNAGSAGFVDVTDSSGLLGITGGLNMVHADYDNDGDSDLLILRGGWRGENGRWVNSLLRNEGNLRFVDVTYAVGLGEHELPTQTAAWADFDNDGDLDLYVGNESRAAATTASNLYRNDGAAGFVDTAPTAGVTNERFAKGVVWGDFDGDRFADLYVSNLGEPNRLYRNNRDGTFTDLAADLGVDEPRDSFSVWFWDANNDGRLDLLVNSYQQAIRAGDSPAVWYVAASRLGAEVTADKPRLYLGREGGTFEEVSKAWSLDRSTLPMGANFGDLDNDGWLDFYLGTGYPGYEGIVPNVMYRNVSGSGFEEVTFAGGFGHLQKGHGIAFADLDNDGDQDVFAQMGGMWMSDAYYDALYENPGFGHRWLTLQLRGTQSNRSAIGVQVRVHFTTPAGNRTVHRVVGTGGSFGSSPLRVEVGLADATAIDAIEIYWPSTDTLQRFENVALDRAYLVAENDAALTVQDRSTDVWSARD